MAKRNIIVIGASSGGFQAVRELVSTLPAKLEAAIFIVWHMPPDGQGVLPMAINKVSALPAAHAVNGEPIKNGRIYVAPPDHHLLLEKDVVRISRGPKENRFRPAVDPLFRSAAHVFGPRVIGIILSGALDDGTAGLWLIKQRGGLTMIQHPEEAEVPAMPENAAKKVKIDYVLRTVEMGPLLSTLVQTEVEPDTGQAYNLMERTQMEIDLAMEKKISVNDLSQFGEWTPYTCPECHGVLSAFKDGDRVRYRCHTGHAFSTSSLLTSIMETIEINLWSVIRNMQESVMLLNYIGDQYAEKNNPRLAAEYFKKAREAENQLQIIKQAVLQHEQFPPDTINGH